MLYNQRCPRVALAEYILIKLSTQMRACEYLMGFDVFGVNINLDAGYPYSSFPKKSAVRALLHSKDKLFSIRVKKVA